MVSSKHLSHGFLSWGRRRVTFRVPSWRVKEPGWVDLTGLGISV